jgi:putative chitinase
MLATQLSRKYITLLTKGKINTPLRLAHFFAQLSHESSLLPILENLNYSAAGLVTTFKKYFPTLVLANKYARQPIKIANKVYADRMGNGSTLSGEGAKFRGRGFIQITGKNNYAKLSKSTGIDYVSNPDLLLREADAMIAAIWYWNVNNLSSHADIDNIDAVSDIVNIGRMTEKYGDSNGFKDRKAKLVLYKKEFKV